MARFRARRAGESVPRFTAKVKTLAQNHGTKVQLTSNEQNIMTRIQKCLSKANHPNTPEMEAQAALRISSRLMTQHNITNTDMLSNQDNTKDTNEDRSQQGGLSIVSILSVHGARVVRESWIRKVATAITTFYDCKVYSTRRRKSHDWSFYGIAANTVAAAMSFETVYNLIWKWSLGRGKAEFSYRHGVASGLRRLARQEKKAEEARAKDQEEKNFESRLRAEQEQRQKELDRLNLSNDTTSGVEFDTKMQDAEYEYEAGTDRSSDCSNRDDDDDDDDETEDDDNIDEQESFAVEPQAILKEGEEATIGNAADFKKELKERIDSKSSYFHNADKDPSSVDLLVLSNLTPQAIGSSHCQTFETGQMSNMKVEEQDLILASWNNHSALVIFRQHAQRIAEDFRAAQGRMTRKRRTSGFEIRDRNAYRQGKQDSQKIDAERRRMKK